MHHLGRVGEAETEYRAILREFPDNPVVNNNLGIALVAQKRYSEAIEHLRQAIQASPDYAEAHCNMGNALRHAGDLEIAKEAFDHALKLNPEFVQALGNLGNTHMDLGELDDAEACYKRAVKIMPDIPDLHYNLGRVLYEQANWDAAEDAFRQTLKLNGSHPLAHWNLSHTLLMNGEYSEAWPHYEWRWRCPGFTTQIPDFGKPRWNGSSLDKRTILVFAEQGFGDTIQFIRYVPKLTAAGATVEILCQPELERLFAGVEGINGITSNTDELPPFDVHCPLISLPLLTDADSDTVPADIPYIAVPDGGAALPDAGEGLKIGLVWVGRSTHAMEEQRSLRPDVLAPVLDVEGCQFFALHDAAERGNLAAAGLADMVTDLSDLIDDFGDTARLIDELDLLISVDTAAAHLAGALGKPVWTLLPFIPDWRWMADRTDSPWYPSMQLFRQHDRNDWGGVMADVAAALRKMVSEA